MKQLLTKVGAALGALMMSAASMASTVSGYGTGVSGDAFNSFAATVLAWLQGGLGIGIALIALIVGATLGISNGTAFPMIVGLIIAAGFAFLPQVLDDLVAGASSALLPMDAAVGL